MKHSIADISLIVIFCLVTTFLIWFPHLLRLNNLYNLNFSQGFDTIYRNYDGIEYTIIAKTFYDPTLLKAIPQSLPEKYYASHFPLYSIFIFLISPVFGFLKSMLFISVLATIGAALAFYFLIKNFKLTTHPLLLSLIFLILPARWLIVHSVGSSEPLFIFLTILSVYFFMKYESLGKWSNIHLAGLFGLLAQLTRPPGILIFISFGLLLIYKLITKKERNIFRVIFNYHPLILIPLGLLGVFYWFSVTFNDFFAYFHSGDNIHLTFPPFQVFNSKEFWVGSSWLEDIIYIFILGLYAGILLFKQKLYPMAFFVFTYLAASMLVVHRDISRYTLPIFPFALIAFEKVLTSKEFRIILIILSLAIYLYAQNFILGNTAPYPNVEAFN